MTETRRGRWTAASLLCIALSSLVATSAAASPSRSDGEPSSDSTPGDDQRIAPDAAAQEALLEARRLLESTAALGDGGLATITVDWDARDLHLYWNGSLPAQMSAAVRDVANRLDVPVTLHHAAFSWVELDAIIQSMVPTIRQERDLADVLGLQMEPDLSGLIVHVSSMSVNIDALSIRLAHLVAAKVPLRFVAEGWEADIEPTEAGSRTDDRPPFIGGARMEYSSGALGLTRHECTTAFAVETFDRTLDGIASAKHCGKDQTWYTPAGRKIGRADMYLNQENDAVVITWPTGGILSGNNPGFSGKIYIGSHTSTATGGIAGSSTPAVGEMQCNSGAMSGVVCSNRVEQVNYYDSQLGLGGPMHVTEQIAGVAAAGNGDSGGPNYFPGTSSSTRIAKGVISAISLGSYVKPCQGEPSGPYRTCSTRSLHTTLQPFLNAFGLRVKTAPPG